MRKGRGLVLAVLATLCGAASAAATPVYWDPGLGGNGHWYETVRPPLGSSWDDAYLGAIGVGGYLVTITSAAENLFLTTDPGLGNYPANGLESLWTGGYQPPGSVEPSGGWSWVTGEPFVYANWWPAEPNNSGGIEDRIVFQHGFIADGKAWNDLAGVGAAGYVVEWDSNPNPIPEPAAVALLGIGLLGLGLRRRPRKTIAPSDSDGADGDL